MHTLSIARRGDAIVSSLAQAHAPIHLTQSTPCDDATLGNIGADLQAGLDKHDWRAVQSAARRLANLLPQTIAQLSGCTLRLELDESIAGFPWEVVPVGDYLLGEVAQVGRAVKVETERQWSRSAMSSDVRSGTTDRTTILIIYDSSLKFAVEEAKQLQAQLANHPRLQLVGVIANADPAYVVSHLGRADIIHFAGHGHSGSINDLERGWRLRGGVLNSGWLLTAAPSQWPLVVFANACPTTPLGPLRPGDVGGDLLGAAFLIRGVQHYISTINPIPDDRLTATFAFHFYEQLVSGASVGEALRRARLALAFPQFVVNETNSFPPLDARDGDGSVAAANYLLYGDPLAALFKAVVPAVSTAGRAHRAFADYLLGETLEESPFRIVYRAVSPSGEQVALAIPFDQRPAVVERLQAELQRLRERLRVPGAVPILDVPIDAGRIGIVYELTPGEALNPLRLRAIDAACALVERIAATIDLAHRAGLVHCGLSPSHILADGDVVHVRDIGLATALQAAGAGWYPEQVRYRPREHWGLLGQQLERTADLWALGVLAYEVLTGHHPFDEAPGVPRIVEGHVTPPRLFRSDLSPQLEAVLLKALATERRERYQSAGDLIAAIRLAQGGRSRIGGFEPDLEIALGGRETLFAVDTDDEYDTVNRLQTIASRLTLEFWTWSLTSGLQSDPMSDRPGAFRGDPLGVIRWVEQRHPPVLLVLRDFDAFLDEWPVSVGRLSHQGVASDAPFREVPNAVAADRVDRAVSVIRGVHEPSNQQTSSPAYPKADLWRSLENATAVNRARSGRGSKVLVTARQFLVPPDRMKVVQTFRAIGASGGDVEQILADHDALDADWAKQFAVHAAGLTATTLRDCLRLSIARHGTLGPAALEELQRTKSQEIRKSGLLEWRQPSSTFARDVIGVEGLRLWLEFRRRALLDPGIADTVGHAKGLVIGGLTGAGKSHVADAIAGELGWSLIRMDVGRLYTSRLGGAEENTRSALAQAESISPVVLLLDDLDKSFGAVSSDGVGLRVLQTLLTWLQERQRPVLFVATMSDPRLLPIELVRSGRIDACFFLDLPGRSARAQLLAHFLRRWGRSVDGHDFDALAVITEGWSAADLLGAVENALFAAVHAGRAEPSREELAAAIDGPRTPSEESLRVRDLWLSMALPAAAPAPFVFPGQRGAPPVFHERYDE